MQIKMISKHESKLKNQQKFKRKMCEKIIPFFALHKTLYKIKYILQISCNSIQFVLIVLKSKCIYIVHSKSGNFYLTNY